MATTAAATSKATVARRVVRGLTDEFVHFHHPRKELSYRGGWQNATQKLQWFWFGFKKYGFLANLANMARMRESWWESGEKRLIGMDAMGHKYWETDDPGRTYAWGYRFPDYPHHFHFADQSKIPRDWLAWTRQAVGRSPPQLEALHKELGPDWRDYNLTMTRNFHLADEADTHTNPQGVDGYGHGFSFTHPFSPDFKTAREYYGNMATRHNHGSMRTGLYASTHQDEFDPEGGALTKLAADGLQPDGYNQHQVSKGDSGVDDDQAVQRFEITAASNFQQDYNEFDKGKRGLAMWWEYRNEQGDAAKKSRAEVSAFDDPLYSAKNKAGTTFGFINRYKEIDPYTTEGYGKSQLNPKNHQRDNFYNVTEQPAMQGQRDAHQSRHPNI
eukprot:TRINITY_DN12403_c0_g1_i1.p2 TRINITY_DN12403_c0_g1~~TRINITY_DN12403_c0_g1_i1.p2  ORF type:complete len:406 (+),score=134.19 TRINITY_DN12403_c0_g1_i1:63-1220(+)